MTLLFFALYKPIRRDFERNFCTSLLSFPFLFSSPFSSFSSYYLLKFSTATHLLLLLKCVFLSFYTCFHVLWDDCWWNLFKSWEMFYGHGFMVVWCGISRVWSCLLVYMKELRSAENRTQSMHDVWIFWIWYRCVCIFLIFFLDSRLPYENFGFWITSFHWV